MKKNFEEYKAELESVWGVGNHMVDWCLKKTDNVVRLDNGWLIPIDKKNIEKDFCFGYHDSRYDTESYDEANRMADHARNSEDYFFEENMKGFRRELADFDDDRYRAVVSKLYINGGDNLKSVNFMRDYEICDAFGGSCYMSEIDGKTVSYRGVDRYILKKDEIEKIKGGISEAMKNHEKRVRTYLKKYGTKHVNSWSYWIDR